MSSNGRSYGYKARRTPDERDPRRPADDQARELERERLMLHGPEPVESPDWCSACGSYGHNSLDCRADW